MPGRPRQVDFAPIPASYSRLPRDDERLVMQRFCKHAMSCADCHLSKAVLCSRGFLRGKDVEDYLFQKSGKLYSAVDLEAGRRMQVEIPAEYGLIRELFKAISQGVRVRGSKETSSPNKAYYVPQKSSKADVERKPRVPKHEIEAPKRKHALPSQNKSQRGHDRHDRARQSTYSSSPPAYYQVGAYGAMPMQPYTYGPDAYGYYY